MKNILYIGAVFLLYKALTAKRTTPVKYDTVIKPIEQIQKRAINIGNATLK